MSRADRFQQLEVARSNLDEFEGKDKKEAPQGRSGSTMRKMTYRVTNEEYEALNKEAARIGVPVTSLVRMAIRERLGLTAV